MKAAEEKVNVKNKISGKKANKNTKNDNSSEEEGYFKKLTNQFKNNDI